MRKVLTFFTTMTSFIFLISLTMIEAAAENKIQMIDIEVELHADASATIREKRRMISNEDTEVYIQLSNLGASELVDFEVAGFQKQTPWDIEASFAEKAYKYGVLSTNDGYELAWGISEYGLQEYNLTYHLTNLVRELKDGQALFWNFDSFLSLPTDRMQLTIYSDEFSLADEWLEYFAFGFESPINITTTGAFEWTGYDLDSSNEVIALLQFPPGTFQTQAKVDQSLAEQKEIALAGSSYNEEPPLPVWAKFLFALAGIFGVGVGGAGVLYAVKRSNVQKENQHFNPRTFKDKTKVNISKQAPYLEGAYEHYAWLINKLAPSGGGYSEYFMLYLLAWAKAGRIKIYSEEPTGNFRKNEKARIEILNFSAEDAVNVLDFSEYVELFELGESNLEEVVWGMLLELADAKGQVSGKEIEKWSKKHAESIYEMLQLLEERSIDWLITNGYLDVFEVKVWTTPVKIEQLTTKGEKLAFEMVAYQNFIEKLIETELAADENWEMLIEWTILFGLAESTIQELRELDPVRWAQLEVDYPYYYGNYYSYYYLYTRTTHGLSAGGYSSAGGGFSSAGGGAGAGGGGGGGTR